MENGHVRMQCRCKQCLLEASNALVELRDALNLLSLSLSDLRFEIDRERREAAARAVEDLMRSVAETPRTRQQED